MIDLHNTTARTGVCILTAPADPLSVALAASLIEDDMVAMAKDLKDSILSERPTCVGGPLDVDLQRVWRTRSASFNVEIWACPAYGN